MESAKIFLIPLQASFKVNVNTVWKLKIVWRL
jgi:hypothetical protein